MRLYYFKFLYFFYMIFCSFMIFFSKSIFFFWVSLELVTYSFILVLWDKRPLSKNFFNSVSASNSYFILQSLGSIFFCLSAFFNFSSFLFFFSISVKMGMFPLFWWLPFYCKELDSFSFFMYLTFSKWSLFYLLSLVPLSECMLSVLFLGSLLGVVGMWHSVECFKTFMSWGSLVDKTLMIFIFSYSVYNSFFFFFFYFLFYFLFFLFLSKNSFFFSFSSGFMFMLMFFVGVPVFLKFLYKLVFVFSFFSFFSGIYELGAGLLLFFFFLVILLLQSIMVIYFFLIKSFLYFSKFLSFYLGFFFFCFFVLAFFFL